MDEPGQSYETLIHSLSFVPYGATLTLPWLEDLLS